MIDDLDEWEKTMEQFEFCQGVLTEADRQTILLRKLPTSISSSLLSNLRKIPTYVDMKAEIESEIVLVTTAQEVQQGMRTSRTSEPRLRRRSRDSRQMTTRKASSSSTLATCRPSSPSLSCLRRDRPGSRFEPPSGARAAGTSSSRSPSSRCSPECRLHLAQASGGEMRQLWRDTRHA